MLDIDACTTLAQLWDCRVSLTPNRDFLVFEDCAGGIQRFTYAAFDAVVSRVARHLRACGIAHGDKVMASAPNRPETLALWLGCARIGAAFVAVGPCLSQDDARYFEELCRPKAIAVIDAEHYSDAAAMLAKAATCLVIEGFSKIALEPRAFEDAQDIRDDVSVSVDEDATVGVVFTSGSTSRPKGVEITQGNAVHAARACMSMYSMRSNDRFAVAVPVFHVDALYGVACPCMLAGAQLVLFEKYSASRYIGQCARHGATLSHCVAMMVKTMLLQRPSDIDSQVKLRTVSFFMPLTAAERSAFEQRFGAKLVSCYGLSETVTSVAAEIPGQSGDSLCIGPMLPPFEGRIVDDGGCAVGPGEAGELWVRGIPGKTIMKGYLNNPEATAAAIVDGEWLKTGDLAYFDECGRLHFVDRIKSIVKCKGENISTLEVEQCLRDCPGVVDAAAFGVPDKIYGERLVALVEAPAACAQVAEDALDWCWLNLAAFKVPMEFAAVDALPRTQNGKVDRHALAEVYSTLDVVFNNRTKK